MICSGIKRKKNNYYFFIKILKKIIKIINGNRMYKYLLKKFKPVADE